MKLDALLSTYKDPAAPGVFAAAILVPSIPETLTSNLIYALYGSQNPLSLMLNLITSPELTPLFEVLNATGVYFYYLIFEGYPTGLISL